MKERIRSNQGFSLVELMVAAAVLLIAFVGILTAYARCLELSELSRNTSIAINAAKSRIEAIKNTQFNQIFANFNNVTFTDPALTGIGVSYVDNTNPELLVIRVTFCWRQAKGRIIGEDTNLNGVVNAGEDGNGNGLLDSPVQLVTSIYQI